MPYHGSCPSLPHPQNSMASMEGAEGNLLLAWLPDNCWRIIISHLSQEHCAALRQTCKSVQRAVDSHVTYVAVRLIVEARSGGGGAPRPKGRGILRSLRRLLQRFQESYRRAESVQPHRMVQQPGNLQTWPALAALKIIICAAPKTKHSAVAPGPAQCAVCDIPCSGLSSVFLNAGRMLTALQITALPLSNAWLMTTDTLCSMAAGCPSLVLLELSNWKLSTTSFAALAGIRPLRALRLDTSFRHSPKLVTACGDFFVYDLSWLAACASLGALTQLERLEVGAPVCWSQSMAAAWARLTRLTALRVDCLGPEGDGGQLCAAPLPVSPGRTAELLVSYPLLHGFYDVMDGSPDPSLTACGQHLRSTLLACGPALTGLHVGG